MKFSDVAITYMLNKATTDRTAALASLTLLLENPAGVGDHSIGDLHKSLDEAIASLSEADDRMRTIQRYFMNNSSPADPAPTNNTQPSVNQPSVNQPSVNQPSVNHPASNNQTTGSDDKPSYTLKF